MSYLLSSTLVQTSFQPALQNHLEKFLTGMLLTLALGVTASNLPAAGTEIPVQLQQISPQQAQLQSMQPQPLQEGIYVYGQSPEANQIGSVYMVFQVSDHQVTGAFYMPSSSFDCFRGEFQADQLALIVTDSYEQTHHPYTVALAVNTPVATSHHPLTALVDLVGYHQLSDISDTDRRILSTCQANL
jgi:hypothetical protein